MVFDHTVSYNIIYHITIQEVPCSIPGYILEIFSGSIGLGSATGSAQLREDKWVAI